MPAPALAVYRVPGIPLVDTSSDLVTVIGEAVSDAGLQPKDGDVFVVAQKIISKAEGCVVDLNDVTPSARALELVQGGDKDPRLVELVLRESKRIVRHNPFVIIVEHRLGIVMANAGIDRSNVSGNDDIVLLLPRDPDASAAQLKQGLEDSFGVRLGVLIIDSVGRPWRLGTTGIAIGCAGLTALSDRRGQHDLFERELQVAEVATADCLAGTASLIMGEGAEAMPVVLVRGVDEPNSDQTAKSLLRSEKEDLFR